MYEKIVVPLDGSELAECVLPHLETFLKNLHPKTVELIRVVTPVELHYKAALPIDAKQEKQINQLSVKEAEDYLSKVKERLESEGTDIKIKVLSGHAADALKDYLDKSEADLLFIATHGRSGITRWVMGSVADKLIHIAQIPVFLVRPDGCNLRI